MRRNGKSRLLPGLSNEACTPTRPKRTDKNNQSTEWFRFKNWEDDDLDEGSSSVPSSQDGNVLEIYIYDMIGGWFGTNSKDFVDELNKFPSATQINLHLDSPGGAIFDGVAIYNALLRHQANVTVYVDALAASAASFIAQAGDEVVMAMGSMMMIHDGSGLAYGNAADMRDLADLLDKLSDNIAGIYADRTGDSIEHWRGFMLAETWYTAKEAVDAGLADRAEGRVTADPENHWDLSAFNYAGRNNAPSPQAVLQNIVNKENNVSGNSSKEAPPVVTPPPVVAPVAPVEAKVEPASVLINGQAVTDLAAVQAHITVLEGFQNETRTQNRKDFVAKLASDNKVLASQMDSLEAFALGLSVESYEAWTKTWDVAPASAVLENHADVTNSDGKGGNASDESEEIKTNRAIVKSLKDGGMKPAALEKTKAYVALKAAGVEV